MSLVKIEAVTISGIRKLQKIGRDTFAETFADGNTEENLKKYLEEGFSVEKLMKELSDQNSAFYFASLGDRVIGYLKLNEGPAQTELREDKALEIERIYVLKEFHGKKVGQLLYDKAIEVSRQKKADYVWLGVWEKNPRAIHFYRKNGFVEFDRHLFRLGDEEQTDIMMKRTLSGDAEGV